MKGFCLYHQKDFDIFLRKQKQKLIEHHGKVLNIIEKTVGSAFFKRPLNYLHHIKECQHIVLCYEEIEYARVISFQFSPPINITLNDGSTITAQELLVAIGRKPNTDKIGLETVGLTPGDWLQVDDTCLVQGVEGEWLYAIGDINHRALLTHIAKYQGRACANAIIARAHGTLRSSNSGSS